MVLSQQLIILFWKKFQRTQKCSERKFTNHTICIERLRVNPKNVAIDVNVIKKEDQKLTLKERIAEFIRATFFIPDARVGWLLTAKKKAIEFVKNIMLTLFIVLLRPTLVLLLLAMCIER